MSGAVLLCGYLIFDSFTANWQSALFKGTALLLLSLANDDSFFNNVLLSTEHQPSAIQMMCGVNLMSCLFTSASLIQQGGFYYSLAFASRVREKQ